MVEGMRISRHCYDKPHRCPGWAGGGWKFAKVHHCDNGRIQIDYDDRWYKWQIHRCNTCDVRCLPIVVQWLDYRWWGWWLTKRVKWTLEEKLLWPLQKALVLALYTKPLRFGNLAYKLDQRWNTRVWEWETQHE